MATHEPRSYRRGRTNAPAQDGAHAGTRTDTASAAVAHRDPAELIAHAETKRVPEMDAVEARALLADIAERGLLAPLDVTEDGTVLDGQERLRAALELGLDQVPVRIVAPDDELGYILRAALRRRNLTPAQKAAVALELIDYEERREQALERRQANLRGRSLEVATLPLRGKTRDYVAEVAGCAARTAQDVITVREDDPALFEQVKAGRRSAHQEAQEIARRRRREKLGAPPSLPTRLFPLVYADPPWASDNLNVSWAPENHYPTMSLEQIKALRIPAAEEALLLLWAVNCQLPQALEVVTTWGFEYKGNFAWIKPSPGVGQRIRNQHELLLLATRGSFPCPAAADVPVSVIEADRGPHSQKPECVYELIERMYPDCPKLELFARGEARRGWTAWGNEAEQ